VNNFEEKVEPWDWIVFAFVPSFETILESFVVVLLSCFKKTLETDVSADH
jgi:hypothetical protein